MTAARVRRAAPGWEVPPRAAPRDGGSLSLEFALVVPVVFVLVMLVFHAAVYARDGLVAQDAARAGARAAATTTSDEAVVAIVEEAVDGRPVDVVITPRARRPGQLVTVAVTLTSRAGMGTQQVSARAVAVVEPGVGG
ncbi:MAG: pilus assembly protein [Actinobacteria bacterium]|nr:pilus assembly protein [Actinomycetota bacterium]